MMQLPKCEICGEEIRTLQRYKVGDVYVCPDCMHENMVRALRNLDVPITNALDEMKCSWQETNDTVYAGEVDPAEELYFDLIRDAYQ